MATDHSRISAQEGRGNTVSRIRRIRMVASNLFGDAALQRSRPHTTQLPRPDNYLVPIR